MLHTKFRGNRPAGSGEEEFLPYMGLSFYHIWKKGFYHIWAWRPSWSCDPNFANKLSFLLPMEVPHKISF